MTSRLTRRKRKGLRMVCKFLIKFSWISTLMSRFVSASSSSFSKLVSSSKLNHCWNKLRSLKISGRIKLSKDHNSFKLFCKGVPVMISLFAVGNCFKHLINADSRFLRR